MAVRPPNIVLITTISSATTRSDRTLLRSSERRTSTSSPAKASPYERAYAESPLCVPSRVSLMTGKSALSTADRRAEPHVALATEVARWWPEYVVGGYLVSAPQRERPAAEARIRGWPGYATDWYPIDVRH